MNGVRMDKWLWAARFFKTRALATKACELGRVSAGGQQVKASREVRVGDKLSIRNNSGTFAIEVLALSDMRGPPSVAQTLYVESEESKQARLEAAQQRKAMPFIEALPEGKLSKRDRRRFDWVRGRR